MGALSTAVVVAQRGTRPVPFASPLSKADRALLDYEPSPPWPSSSARAQTQYVPAFEAEQRHVAAAVLEHLRHNNGSGVDDPKRICVEVFGADADVAILSRFSNPPAFPKSACVPGNDLFLRVNAISIIDDTHAEATGGYRRGRLSADSHAYWLEKRDGRWVVVGDVLEWVS